MRGEALLGRRAEGISRTPELPAGSWITEAGVAAAPSPVKYIPNFQRERPEVAAAAAAPSPGKYIPEFRRERPESSGRPPSEPDRWLKPAPPEPDRRTAGSRAPPPQSDHWTSGSRAVMQDSDRFGSGGSRALPPDSDRLGSAGGSNRPEPWRPSRGQEPTMRLIRLLKF